MPFEPAFLPKSGRSDTDWWFVFCGDRLLVKATAIDLRIPSYSDLIPVKQNLSRTSYLGTFGSLPCYSGEVDEDIMNLEGISFQELRPLLGLLGEEIFSVAARAFQILHWDRTHQFCGRCGGQTEPKDEERARVCTQCGLVHYPTVSPATIVAVTKGRQILLARSHRFHSDFYSVLAGFVEYGETFEECVKREVKEEVGIDVKNIRYFGSQHWPFPNTLMVGFTAEYGGGAITPDDLEIKDARWFDADDLPAIPMKGSIARRLIDWFIEECG
ncbi:MAG TPA: NAD(+) diphosphatase [Thermodesulfovibrionales bacterium]|nr:NAD(+) diphosphatase [Thermodesulfovibrionales bacterium]